MSVPAVRSPSRRTAIVLTRKQAATLAKLTDHLRVTITVEQVSHTRSTRTYANIHSGHMLGRYVISRGGMARRLES